MITSLGMLGFWYFVPKSGLIFVVGSVALVLIWKSSPNFFLSELALFLVCLLGTIWESTRK